MQGCANRPWIPAFAGMTEVRVADRLNTIERSVGSAHPTYNPRHPREGGDPGGTGKAVPTALDSRLRGPDKNIR